MNSCNKVFYSVEGNIGSGKTTLVNLLQKHDSVEIVKEPVDLWMKIGLNETNILQAFYKDPKKYAFLFQMIVYSTMVDEHNMEQVKQTRISERYPDSSMGVFGNLCIKNELMDDVEASAYKHWYEWLRAKYTIKPDCIIYIGTSPEKCYERIQKRGRKEEEGITLEYLKQVHQMHLEFFRENDIRIYFVNNDMEDNNFEAVIEKILSNDI